MAPGSIPGCWGSYEAVSMLQKPVKSSLVTLIAQLFILYSIMNADEYGCMKWRSAWPILTHKTIMSRLGTGNWNGSLKVLFFADSWDISACELHFYLSVSFRPTHSPPPQPWDSYQYKADCFEEKGVLRLQPLNVPTATEEFSYPFLFVNFLLYELPLK